MKSNKLKREPKYIAKFKAFPYQQEAVDAVKDLELLPKNSWLQTGLTSLKTILR